MERSKAGREKKSRRPITFYSNYSNNKHNIVVFYKIWKKYNEIQLTKNKIALNNQKMTNHPPSPVSSLLRDDDALCSHSIVQVYFIYIIINTSDRFRQYVTIREAEN